MGEEQSFPLRNSSSDKATIVDASQLFKQPHRATRPDHFVIILRGLPGINFACSRGILLLSSILALQFILFLFVSFVSTHVYPSFATRSSPFIVQLPALC